MYLVKQLTNWLTKKASKQASWLTIDNIPLKVHVWCWYFRQSQTCLLVSMEDCHCGLGASTFNSQIFVRYELTYTFLLSMSSEGSLLLRLSTPFVDSPCSSCVQSYISTIAIAVLLLPTWPMFLYNPELALRHKILPYLCKTHFLMIYHTYPTNKQL